MCVLSELRLVTQRLKSCPDIVPGTGLLWSVFANRLRGPNDIADFGQRRNISCGSGLQQNISQCRGFNWSREDRSTTGICRKLIQ